MSDAPWLFLSVPVPGGAYTRFQEVSLCMSQRHDTRPWTCRQLCMQSVYADHYRGMGRQAAIMIFNLAGFWGIGVPCGYVFTFILNKGIVGLW